MRIIIKKGTQLNVIASTNPRTLEVLRVTKQGFEARSVKDSGKDVMHTGFEWFGITYFKAALKAGYLTVAQA